MKYITGILLAILMGTASAGFVHPMDFDGSAEAKKEVIEYIKDNTYQSVCLTVGLCSEYMLRLSVDQALDSFKYLTKQTDRKVMDRTISDLCGIGLCGYYMIQLSYDQNVKAKGESLEW